MENSINLYWSDKNKGKGMSFEYILNPSIRDWPLPANGIIFTAILVIGLTYFAMPALSRLLRRWLYSGK